MKLSILFPALALLSGIACLSVPPAPPQEAGTLVVIEDEPTLIESIGMDEEQEFVSLTPQLDPAEEEVTVELFIPEDVSMLPPHPAVQRLIEYYRGDGREKFQDGLERLAPVYRQVAGIFSEAGLPEHYLFLGMVESTFKVKARSRVGAYGPWQFMPSTARLYGLTVSTYVDDRASWDTATEASARYLKELIDEFDSLELALASYNAGKGRVKRARRRCHKKDFWQIRRCLPRETRNFIPSVLAAMAIGQNPEAYGFTFKAAEESNLVTVPLPTSFDLKKLAVRLGLEKTVLTDLNPRYVTGFTPPPGGKILVPIDVSDRVLSELPVHTVLPGESLVDIASRYELSTKNLLAANGMSGSSAVTPGQKFLIPELPKQFTYRVRRGDSPWSISRKFRVPLSRLLARNGLSRRSRIFPGQKLIIPGKMGSYRESSTTHRVRPGDTLFNIARRYDTTVNKIKRVNGLSSNLIKPGDLLIIN